MLVLGNLTLEFLHLLVDYLSALISELFLKNVLKTYLDYLGVLNVLILTDLNYS